MQPTREDLLGLLKQHDLSLYYWSKLLNTYERIFYLEDRDIMMVYARVEMLRLWWNHVENARNWIHCTRDEVSGTIYEDARRIMDKNVRVVHEKKQPLVLLNIHQPI